MFSPTLQVYYYQPSGASVASKVSGLKPVVQSKLAGGTELQSEVQSQSQSEVQSLGWDGFGVLGFFGVGATGFVSCKYESDTHALPPS